MINGKGQILIEALIVIPVILLVSLGIIQLVFLAVAKASVNYASFSVAREIEKDPTLIEQEGFNKAKIELLKVLTPVSPSFSETVLGNLENIMNLANNDNSLKNLKTVKSMIGKFKKSSISEQVLSIIDKAIFPFVFASYQILPENKQRKIDLHRKNNVFNPVPYITTVKFWYPLMPFIGKLYCTKFYFSKGAVKEKIDKWIDSSVYSFNMYLSEKVNDEFDNLLNKSWKGIESEWGAVTSFTASIVNKEKDLDKSVNNYYDKITTVSWKIKQRCNLYKDKVDSIYSVLNGYQSELKEDLDALNGKCSSLGESELNDIITSYRKIHDSVNGEMNAVLGQLSYISDTYDKLCKIPGKYSNQKINFNIPTVDCSLNLPCSMINPDLAGYTVPNLPKGDAIYFIPAAGKAFDKSKRKLKGIKTDIENVKDLANNKIDELKKDCYKGVDSYKNKCQGVNSSIDNINGEVTKINNKINDINEHINSFCYSNKNKITEIRGSVKSLYLPDVPVGTGEKAIISKKGELCNKLKNYGNELYGKISGKKSEYVETNMDKFNHFYNNCISTVNDFDDKTSLLYRLYDDVKNNIGEKIVNNKILNNPKSVIKNEFRKGISPYWDDLYDEENTFKSGVKQKCYDKIISKIPDFGIPDPKKCNPYLYFVGIYAVPISSTEIAVLNPASVIYTGEENER